jgi:hypothetical protein
VTLALSWVLPAFAQADGVELGGVRLDTSVQVGGKGLVLNGAGVRYRLMFKVVAVALYVPVKAQTTEAILAAPGPKRIQLVMLRGVSGNEIGKVLSTGIEANASRQEFIAVLPAIARFGEAVSQMKALSPGDSIVIDWVPDAGTAFFVNGKLVAGPYADFATFSGISKIWLGRNAADAPLREALLGRGPAQGGPVDPGLQR